MAKITEIRASSVHYTVDRRDREGGGASERSGMASLGASAAVGVGKFGI